MPWSRGVWPQPVSLGALFVRQSTSLAHGASLPLPLVAMN